MLTFCVLTSVVAFTIFLTGDKTLEKYQELRSMYDYLYHVNHGSHLSTLFHIVQSTWSILRVYATQYVFHNSKRKAKNTYEIEYTINCRPYRFIVHYKPGPSKYKHFFVNETKDVSDIVFPFVGPNDDFHSIRYTPKDLGFDNLTIHFMNGDLREVKADEVILQ